MHNRMSPITCPRCKVQFGSTNRLSRHLRSRVRRFRCGIFSEPVRFTCECGRTYTSIRLIKAHLTRDHTRRGHREVGRGIPLNSNVTRTAPREVGFYREDPDGVDDRAEEGDIVTNLPPPRPNSNGVSEPVHDATFSSPAASFSYASFHELVNGNRRLKALSQLYKYCLTSACTVRAYRQLAELDVMDQSYLIPKQRRGLRSLIMDSVEETSGWVALQTFTLPSYRSLNISPTPFMTVMDALRIWLSLPIVLAQVRDSMMKHLPDNLIDVNSYEEMIQKQADDILRGSHVYETVADGSEYLPSIRACVDKFRSAYIKALEDDIEVIVCSVAFFEDGYRKQKDSLVNQHMFCLTLRK